MGYVGRFAPSPTGPLHAGSLLSAVGSWLDARAQGGTWHLRIDDLDRFRCRPEFATLQRSTLEAFDLRTFSPQGVSPPLYQSTRQAAYDAAIEALQRRLPLFACNCSRRDRRAVGEDSCLSDCRTGGVDPANAAWRADLSELRPMRVADRSLGEIRFEPSVHRDVIVRRRDGLTAYALAVVVDDAALGVTDVVRGGDLLAGTAWQLALQQALNLPTPRYLHLPVVIEPDGRKLAKSHRAVALDPLDATHALRRTLTKLKQSVPPEHAGYDTPGKLLEWASARWTPSAFAGLAEVPAETDEC